MRRENYYLANFAKHILPDLRLLAGAMALLLLANICLAQPKRFHAPKKELETLGKKSKAPQLARPTDEAWAGRPSDNVLSLDSIEISQIQIEGNDITKDWVIMRELQLRIGDRLHIREIDSLLQLELAKVQNTNLFVSSEVKYNINPDRSVSLLVKVLERWYTFPMLVFDVGDRNFNEWWQEHNRDPKRLVYGITFKQQNVRGRNETLRLNFRAGFRQMLRVSYSIPYIDKARTVGLSLDVGYEARPSIAYQTIGNKLKFVDADGPMRAEFGGNITLSKRRGYYGTHRAWLGYSNMRVADTVAQLNANFFGAGQAQFAGAEVGYGYVHDFRDNNAYPLKGHFFSAETRWRGIGNMSNHVAMRANYAKFLPLSKRLFFSTDWMGGYAFAPNVALPYTFSAGLGYGKNFVRGYDLFVIDGEAAGMIRNDLRFKAFEKELELTFMPVKQFSKWPITIFPKAFFDAGYVHSGQMRTEMNALSNRLLLGGGLGLDVITSYNNAFRFECSVNQQGQRGFYFYWKAGF